MKRLFADLTHLSGPGLQVTPYPAWNGGAGRWFAEIATNTPAFTSPSLPTRSKHVAMTDTYGVIAVEDDLLVFAKTPTGFRFVPLALSLTPQILEGYLLCISANWLTLSYGLDEAGELIAPEILYRRLGDHLTNWQTAHKTLVLQDAARLLEHNLAFTTPCPSLLTKHHNDPPAFWDPLSHTDPIPEPIANDLLHIARLLATEERDTNGFSLFLKVGIGGQEVGQNGRLSPMTLLAPNPASPMAIACLARFQALHGADLAHRPWLGHQDTPGWLMSKPGHQPLSGHAYLQAVSWLHSS